MIADTPEIPVLIAGAGPIGLTAAIELARRGIGCRIIDPITDRPHYTKAVGVQPCTLEVFEGMGMLRRSLDAAVQMRADHLRQRRMTAQLELELPADVLFGFDGRGSRADARRAGPS